MSENFDPGKDLGLDKKTYVIITLVIVLTAFVTHGLTNSFRYHNINPAVLDPIAEVTHEAKAEVMAMIAFTIDKEGNQNNYKLFNSIDPYYQSQGYRFAGTLFDAKGNALVSNMFVKLIQMTGEDKENVMTANE